jgi:hypothetical protein
MLYLAVSAQYFPDIHDHTDAKSSPVRDIKQLSIITFQNRGQNNDKYQY